MNLRDAFLEDVLARPEDPVVKLVFADWLEENGRPDLAHAYRWMARRGYRPGQRLRPLARKPWAWWHPRSIDLEDPPDRPAVGGVWPQCVEVQGANANHGLLIFLRCKRIDSKYDQAARDRAVRPVGQWNTTEATCAADGSIRAQINGTPVSSGKGDLTEGRIGFQSEGAEIHFCNILIKGRK
jgi:uncharacterized protein (TIGR02996 family)